MTDIEIAIANINHYLGRNASMVTLDYWRKVLAERRQIQQDLSEAQELSRIREAQIKEELDCISSFQLQLQDKEEELSNTLALADLEQLSHKSSMELYRHDLDDLRQGLQAKEQENRRLREVIEKAPLPSSSGAVFEKFGDPKQWMGEYIEWWLLRQKALVDKTNA